MKTGVRFLTTIFLLLSFSAFAGPIDDLQPGHWYEVPNSHLDSVDPCPSSNCSYSGNLGVSGVMDAWSGGAFDSARNRLMVWGGGHNGYAGNEVYAFDIEREQWLRLTEPSTQIVRSVSHYPDGNPTSRHSYNDLQYDAQNDWLISLNTSASYSLNGDDFRTVDALDLATGQWIRLADRPSAGGIASGAFSAHNPATGKHYIHLNNGGVLQAYDPASNSWSNHVNTGGVPIYMTADVDSTRNRLVAVGAGKIFIYDLSQLDAQPLKNVATGDLTAQNASQVGFAYDPVSDQFVAWAGGTSVYTLDPETWQWTRRAPAASNTVSPSPVNMNGTYGRFRYVPSKNAFIVVNDVDRNVYYYKLSAGGGQAATPTVTFSASPQSVSSGAAAILTWSSNGANSCTASGAWSGNRPVSGSASTGPLTTTSEFRIDCTGAGGTSSREVTVSVSAGGAPPPASSDWEERSTAPGVLMATRFDTEEEVLNWRAGSQQDHVSWDTNLRSSGSGSMRFEILSTDGAANGNWARWLSDDQREFGPGDEYYVQFRQYIPAFYATHPFLNAGGWKQAIISRNAASMNGVPQSQPYGSNQGNAIILQNTNHRGIVQGYSYDTDGRSPPWDVATSNACAGSDFVYQNAVDRGVQNLETPCENDRARYGGLYSYYIQQPSGYVQGSPDPLSGAFRYYPDEWLTFLIHVRLGQFGQRAYDTHVSVYAARDGGEYDLLIDRVDIDLGNGPFHNTLWLLPYNTGRSPDAGRPDTFTNYDEVIVSMNFIPAPNSSGMTVRQSEPPSNLRAD